MDVRLQELKQAVRQARMASDLANEDMVDNALRLDTAQRLAGLRERAAIVHAQAEKARGDREFQTELEQIRLSQADQGERLARTGGTFFSVGAADKRYEEAFRRGRG